MAHIKIEDTTPREQYTATEGQTDFPIPFAFFQDADIKVYEDQSETPIAPALYNLSGAGQTEGGTLAYIVGKPAGTVVTITRESSISRTNDFTDGGDWTANNVNDEFDKLTTFVQEIRDLYTRAIKLPVFSALSNIVFPDGDAGKAIVWNATGDALTNSTSDFQAVVGEAEAARDAAQAAQSGAETAEAGAGVSETNAANSATAAGNSETAAAASAALADAVVASAPFRDVIFLTNADSPYTVTQAQNGMMLSVDTSGGAVIINLPSIAAVTLPFNITVKKTSGDATAVTVDANGTDVIGSSDAPTEDIVIVGGATYIADTDPTPNKWSTSPFGAAAGDMTTDSFVAITDFTPGVTTQLTLSAAPGSKNNTWINFGGAYQAKPTYSVSANIVTFTQAIPLGVDEIDVVFGTTLSVGVPGDNTVGPDQATEGLYTDIREIPQNSQSAAYTLVLSDGGKHIFHPSVDTTARTWTIPANVSVAYPIGTAITFVNQDSAGVITIAITSDTMRLAGDGSTGNRTLDANGVATALKVDTTEWIISGTGLT